MALKHRKLHKLHKKNIYLMNLLWGICNPPIFISPWQLTWSQCSSTSRFSAELFGCIADCKACIAKKLRKQLGESFCLTPAQSAWRDSLNSIFLSPMSVSNIYPDDRCGLCPSRNESQQGLVSSQVWHDQTSFILICVPAIFTFHLPCACRLRPYQVQLFIRS